MDNPGDPGLSLSWLAQTLKTDIPYSDKRTTLCDTEAAVLSAYE